MQRLEFTKPVNSQPRWIKLAQNALRNAWLPTFIGQRKAYNLLVKFVDTSLEQHRDSRREWFENYDLVREHSFTAGGVPVTARWRWRTPDANPREVVEHELEVMTADGVQRFAGSTENGFSWERYATRTDVPKPGYRHQIEALGRLAGGSATAEDFLSPATAAAEGSTFVSFREMRQLIVGISTGRLAMTS